MRTVRRLLLLPLASLALFAGCGEQDKQHRQVLQALEDLRVEVAQLRETVARLEAAATKQAATQSGQVETGGAELSAPKKAAVPSVDRCAATTRAGSRCKREAEPNSRFCWQHAAIRRSSNSSGGR